MRQVEYFVPGELRADEGIASCLQWPIPAGVSSVYVEAYTEPGGMVLIPYCQGPAAICEVLAAGRQVIAINFDPVLILVIQSVLMPPSTRNLNAAVARLGDSPKQGMPLRRYLSELYATSCPACTRPVIAEYFIWDREQGMPVAKQLNCPACSWNGRAPVDSEDRERLAEVPTRGMHYHYLLERVAANLPAETLRARVQPLLELYSPRNLYALAELTLKIESLFPIGPIHRALKVLLLDCLDRCSSIAPAPGSRTQRRSLARPARFLERNVWHAFEEAVPRLQTAASAPLWTLVETLETFSDSRDQVAGVVAQGLVRDLPRLVPPKSIQLILTSPPPLDSATWSLSYLWGAWLLGAEAVISLRPLLRQRTPDPSWYARVMSSSFHTLLDLLVEGGRLVLVLSKQRPVVVEALLLAASQAQWEITACFQSDTDYRLELTPVVRQPILTTGLPLVVQIQRAVVDAAAEVIRLRGEPVPWTTLHAAILKRLAEKGLLARIWEKEGSEPLDLLSEQVTVGLDDPAFVRLGQEGSEQQWWLADPSHIAPPLSDRVEEAAYQILQEQTGWTELEFSRALYAQFPDLLTPPAPLVSLTLRAYGYEATPGHWHLRPEDQPQVRQAEHQIMIGYLLKLGQRLGYRAEPWTPFDVVWFQEKQVQAVFVVDWQAALGRVLALSAHAPGAERYLVIPGGRAALLSYKLAHNPIWRQHVNEARWQFIKYRHVRQLVEQPEIDRYALQAIVGLDPIVEQEGVQIPLF
ncbi:MAG: hypothetical protein ACUVWZ_09230 [Anaerolineae bacterium]